MKTFNYFSSLSLILLLLACSPELDVVTVLPNGLKVKTIKVVYRDDFGDAPQYDGEYYSWVEFDRKGRVKEIKRGTYDDNKSNDFGAFKPYSAYSIKDIVWYLDCGFYSDVSVLAFGGEAWAKGKAKELDHFTDFETSKDAEGRPSQISAKNNAPSLNGYRELFEYDASGRLLSWSIEFDDKTSNSSKRFKYNDLGQLISLEEENKESSLSYDDNKNIAKVIIKQDGKLSLKHEYFYDQDGLRTKSVTYNSNNQREFTQEYEYEFF